MSAALAVTLTIDELELLVERSVAKVLGQKAGEEWMTRDQVAGELSVHPKTVSRLVREKRLQGTRLGRVLRFRRTDLDRYMAALKNGV
jgi:excisionase family DNA binding protein